MRWQKSLNEILRIHGNFAVGSAKVASFATQDARREILKAGFRKLWELGYHLPNVQGFGGRHMRVLGHAWEAQGLSPATIENRINIFRTFAKWIGKHGMIEDSKQYVKDPNKVKREVVARSNKTWSSQNQSLAEKLPAIQTKDRFVAIQLELQRAFGLRMKESALLRPHKADKTHYLTVYWGTQGGRDYIVPIENDYQRDVLARAKRLVHKNDSMIPRDYNFKEWRHHYYYICRQNGISRQKGVTSDGLRNERLNEIKPASDEWR